MRDMTLEKSNEQKSEIVVYQPDSTMRLEVRLQNDNIWLPQQKIADLFGVKKAAISKHLKNIFSSGELIEAATVSKMETVQIEINNRLSLLRELLVTYDSMCAKRAVGGGVPSAPFVGGSGKPPPKPPSTSLCLYV